MSPDPMRPRWSRRTSARAVYAVGDCAEVDGLVLP